MILGFAQAIKLKQCDRPKFERVYGDNSAGIMQEGSGDTSTFRDIRFWPYATVGYRAPFTSLRGDGVNATAKLLDNHLRYAPGEQLRIYGSGRFAGLHTINSSREGEVSFSSDQHVIEKGGILQNETRAFLRSGSAFRFEGQTDDTRVSHLFAFGYRHGYDFLSNGNILGEDIWQDVGLQQAPLDTVGIVFGGAIGRTNISNINANGGYPTVLFDNRNDFATVSIANLFVESGTAHGGCIKASSGNNIITNLQTIGCPISAIDIASAARLQVANAVLMNTGGNNYTPPIRWLDSEMKVDQLKIEHLTTDLQPGVSRDAVHTPILTQITSEGGIARLPFNSNEYILSARGKVQTLLGGWTNRLVTLYISGEVVMTSEAELKGEGNIHLNKTFKGHAGAAISLRYNVLGDGLWREVNREIP